MMYCDCIVAQQWSHTTVVNRSGLSVLERTHHRRLDSYSYIYPTTNIKTNIPVSSSSAYGLEARKHCLPQFQPYGFGPKEGNLKAWDFLQQAHPEYNGTSVMIGILDTGIDPNMTSIRYMVNGTTPKLVELVQRPPCHGYRILILAAETQVS
jgi:hypothetical protein